MIETNSSNECSQMNVIWLRRGRINAARKQIYVVYRNFLCYILIAWRMT